MRIFSLVSGMALLSATYVFGQASGNIAFTQVRARAGQNERSRWQALPNDVTPPASNTMFLEAAVLMNVKADEYVAVFGVSEEGSTIPECNQKMDATLESFVSALRPLGVSTNDYFVDFVAQNRVYGYKVAGDVAKEELAGFELKKNISIHYRDKVLLDKLLLAASGSKIFDLIKVDYVVRDTQSIQNRLVAEAAKILKEKAARYEKLLGTKLSGSPQVYAEKSSVFYPSEQYESYTAAESENIENYYRSNRTIQSARKNRTFFFNPLNGDGFDLVIGQVILEPVVQFTLDMKVKYDIERGKGSK